MVTLDVQVIQGTQEMTAALAILGQFSTPETRTMPTNSDSGEGTKPVLTTNTSDNKTAKAS